MRSYKQLMQCVICGIAIKLVKSDDVELAIWKSIIRYANERIGYLHYDNTEKIQREPIPSNDDVLYSAGQVD